MKRIEDCATIAHCRLLPSKARGYSPAELKVIHCGRTIPSSAFPNIVLLLIRERCSLKSSWPRWDLLSVNLLTPFTCHIERVNEIINGRRGITPGTALRLAKFFGMSADFWMNVQLRWELYRAQQSERDALKAIRRTHRLLRANQGRKSRASATTEVQDCSRLISS